jgi:hypothetical protein
MVQSLTQAATTAKYMKKSLLHPLLVFLAIGLASCARPGAADTLDATTSRSLMEAGGRITAESFALLSSRLKAALDTAGVTGALTYCHAAASPLTDSLSAVYGATVRRTSLAYRNRSNAPTGWETAQLETYRQQEEEGTDLSPLLVRLDDHHVGYAAPILTMPLCLQCHGIVGEDVTEADYAVVRTFYPEDKAVGFRAGPLRGMWSITFDLTKNTSHQKRKT